MKKELDDLLCARYPAIFAERRASIAESCMPRGFSCGDGWFDLIDALCERLQFWTDHNGAPQVVARQVKEKFGELCFYASSTSDEQRGMIYMAAALSARVCEECGNAGKLMENKRGWVLTRCPAHAPADARTLVESGRDSLVIGPAGVKVVRTSGKDTP